MEVSVLETQITNVSDYRIFLKEIFKRKCQANPRFSFRRFAEVVGFKSPNYLQMILDGHRNLTETTAAQIATKLKLKVGERDYFLALVKLSKARTPQELNAAESARLVALQRIVSKEIPASQKEVLTKWFYLPVRELFFLPNAKADQHWIARQLSNCITPEEAKRAFDVLVETGFLVEQGGRYHPKEPVLTTNESVLQATAMRKFHSDTLSVWAKNLAQLGPNQQELGVLNIPMNSSKIPELRERIRAFQDEIIGWVQDEANADQVIQLGTYLIPFGDLGSNQSS